MTAVERSQLFRQGTKMAGLHTVAIDETGSLHTAIGQVVDEAGVAHVAVDHHSAMHCRGLDNVRTVFMAACAGDVTCASQHFMNRGIVLFAPGGPVVRIGAGLAEVALAT